LWPIVVPFLLVFQHSALLIISLSISIVFLFRLHHLIIRLFLLLLYFCTDGTGGLLASFWPCFDGHHGHRFFAAPVFVCAPAYLACTRLLVDTVSPLSVWRIYFRPNPGSA
jgi:hypothetical protein